MRNRVKSATPAMRSFIDDKAEETELPTTPEQEKPDEQEVGTGLKINNLT